MRNLRTSDTDLVGKIGAYARCLGLGLLVLVSAFLPSTKAMAGWDGHVEARVIAGLDQIVSSEATKLEVAAGWPAITIDIGYSFSNGFSAFLEGHFGFWDRLVSPRGSVVATYCFLEEGHLVAPFLLLGVGYGDSEFPNAWSEETDHSGPFQLQFGLGLTFETASWLELGLESTEPVNDFGTLDERI